MREIVLDTETTGLDPEEGHRVIEIGCVELINRVKTGVTYHTYLNPRRDVPRQAFAVHGISGEFLQDKPLFEDIYKEFLDFISDSTLIIHNAKFDLKFLNFELKKIDAPDLSTQRVVDTLLLARKTFPGAPASLDALCKKYKVDLSQRTKHGALLDAELLSDVYMNLTGGRQTKLEFIEQKRQDLVKSMSQNHRQYREPRAELALTEEEENSHLTIMEKIKNPIWK
jgi:DNA polymerase III subunit epsilon